MADDKIDVVIVKLQWLIGQRLEFGDDDVIEKITLANISLALHIFRDL